MKTEENNWKIWQKLYQHSLIESVHLPLAAQAWSSGLSKFTPAPFSCLVKSCWQALCVLLSVHLFLFPNVGCQGSAWDCLELQAGLDMRREPGMTCHVLRHAEPDPDVLWRGEKMTWVWAIMWLLKMWSFWDGEEPCSPAEVVFVPSGYRFQMLPPLWRGTNPEAVA